MNRKRVLILAAIGLFCFVVALRESRMSLDGQLTIALQKAEGKLTTFNVAQTNLGTPETHVHVAIVWLGIKVSGSYSSDNRTTINTDSGNIYLEWTRKTVSINGLRFDRKDGNIFLIRHDANIGWQFDQISKLYEPIITRRGKWLIGCNEIQKTILTAVIAQFPEYQQLLST